MKKNLIHWLGLLGIISLLSYTAAVVFSPLAYPGYRWTAQAVSDLSASNAPSLLLWNQLSALYEICGMISIMMVCVFIQGKLTRGLRIGIYLFAAMNWVSAVGYSMFPLADKWTKNSFQNMMHGVVTALVVLLSVVSLTVIIFSGFHNKVYPSLAGWAAFAFLLMLAGAIGVGTVPKELFGVVERFSVFAATGFNAVLGVYLFTGFSYGTSRLSAN